MEIVQERLEREHKIEVVQTAPTVPYEVVMTDGIDQDHRLRLANCPIPSQVKAIREPMIKASIIIPANNIGDITQLCIDRRGIYKKTEYITADRVILEYDMPLAEVIFDFFDKLKTATQGYGTMDYDFIGFHEDDLVKMDILVTGDKIAALSPDRPREQGRSPRPQLSSKTQKKRSTATSSKSPSRPPSAAESSPAKPSSVGKNVTSQMLRRRHQPQTQAARKAKRRQKAHEAASAASKSPRKPSWPCLKAETEENSRVLS